MSIGFRCYEYHDKYFKEILDAFFYASHLNKIYKLGLNLGDMDGVIDQLIAEKLKL